EERDIARRPDTQNAVAHGALALAKLGEKERPRQGPRRAHSIERDEPIDHYNLGCALAQIGEADQALDLLEASVPKLSPEWVKWMKQDTDLIPLHEHSRYKALIARGETRLAAVQAQEAAKAV